jgi:hypothetical protein
MAASGKVIDLRNLLAERFPRAPLPAETQLLITGISSLDQEIGGGLPKSAITELISPQNQRWQSFVHSYLSPSRTAKSLFSRTYRWTRFFRSVRLSRRQCLFASSALGALQ